MMPTDGKPTERRSADVVDYDEVRRQLSRAVGRICPTWLRNQREDLVQACLVRIVRLFDEDAERKPPAASYIWRVAYSVTLDEIRRQRHRHERPMGEFDEGEIPEVAEPDPERASTARQIGVDIRYCLKRLQPARRHAVMLHHIGHTPKEAAVLLATNAKRVSNLVYRGLNELRRCMTAKGWAP